ncbi:MAG: L,D-transpeptidase [Actinobacteria bacterium]|nr:L,D-transpeptidase [Actinomycetota bacterium]
MRPYVTRRIGLRTCRLALVAVLALLVVVVPALVSGPALASASVELSATAKPATVVFPEKAVVAGVISVPGAAVSLLARPASGGEWMEQDSATAGAGGAFRFTVAPAVSTEYRVLYGEDGSAVAQADVTVRVRPRLTTQFPASLWLGGSVILRGSVRPAHPGGTVVIDRRVAGAWQPLLTVTLDAESRFATRWTPTRFGYYRLRARMDADAEHVAGVAAPERVIVNRPNAHRVPMRFAHYIVIVRHEYRLYYYEHGALVRRFEVALGRPGYRTPLGRFRIYGKRKPAGGALGSCAMFYRRKGGIAIHGTNQPGLIRLPAPRPFSHGCARMLNHQALWLYERVPVGTRVHNLR